MQIRIPKTVTKILLILGLFGLTLLAWGALRTWHATVSQRKLEIADKQQLKTGPQSYISEMQFDYGTAVAGVVKGVRASSTLAPQGKYNYTIGNLKDYNVDTAWVEGNSGQGIGDWIEFTVNASAHAQRKASNRLKLTGLIIMNGIYRPRGLWWANSRVKQMKVLIDGKPWARVQWKNTWKVQSVGFPEYTLPVTRSVKVRAVIESVYPGTRYKDTAITEMSVLVGPMF